jgi:hypothetical protein
MVKFIYDPIVYPIESSWFGEVAENGEIVTMEETIIYQENTFGLRTLDETGRITKKKIDGAHLDFTE